MTTRKLTPEEIKQNLYELASQDIAALAWNLEELCGLVVRLQVSEYGRGALEKIYDARKQLAGIHSHLLDYPIEEEDRTGQPTS